MGVELKYIPVEWLFWHFQCLTGRCEEERQGQFPFIKFPHWGRSDQGAGLGVSRNVIWVRC